MNDGICGNLTASDWILFGLNLILEAKMTKTKKGETYHA